MRVVCSNINLVGTSMWSRTVVLDNTRLVVACARAVYADEDEHAVHFAWNRLDVRAAINTNNFSLVGITSPVARAFVSAMFGFIKWFVSFFANELFHKTCKSF